MSNDYKQIVVFNNNFTNNGDRKNTTRVGGGIPENSSAIGYSITGQYQYINKIYS